MTPSGGRGGAALASTIVLLLLIECVILGTVHLALSETRVATGAQLVLRLRLAAEGGARQAAAPWSADLDSLGIGQLAPERAPSWAEALTTRTSVERLSAALFLIRARARSLPPRHAETSVALLVVAPAFPVTAEPAAAALTASTARIGESGAVHADVRTCGVGPGIAVALTGGADLDVAAAATVRGDITALPLDASLVSVFDRISTAGAIGAAAAASGLHHHSGDLTMSDPYQGVLIVTGDLTLETTVRGLLLVGGALTIGVSGAVVGAAHAAGHADVDGTITMDDCLVSDVVAAARMRYARTLPDRPSVPAF